MTKNEMKTEILRAKKAKGMTWEALATAVGPLARVHLLRLSGDE